MSRAADLDELIENARASQVHAVARLISMVEDGGNEAREIARVLSEQDISAHVVGITGPPGVGKSTITSALVTEYRARGARVAVLAVDPSSPFSGGALLGDRIRMQQHSLDSSVFIRSMASRGHLGGLSAAAPQAVRVLDAAGFDLVIVETVGVGQSEIDVATMADTTVVLLAPGMGDGIQAAKAGILEIGDVFVVNKADREGAQKTRRELRSMMSQSHKSHDVWLPPIVMTVASQGQGISELAQAIENHRTHLEATGEIVRHRKQRLRMEVQALTMSAVSARVSQTLDAVEGRNPYQIMDQVLRELNEQTWT